MRDTDKHRVALGTGQVRGHVGGNRNAGGLQHDVEAPASEGLGFVVGLHRAGGAGLASHC